MIHTRGLCKGNVMQFELKLLAICTLSAMLMACGGGSNSENNDSTPPADGDGNQKPPLIPKYPEPKTDTFPDAVLGYFDFNKEGTTRVIKNDLSGDFQAMVQFAQSHTVSPNGNEANLMPRLASEREALLLITPTAEMGKLDSLTAEIYQNEKLLRTIEFNDPSLIPISDQNNTDDRPRVQYSKRAWSAVLNWDEVRPGLNIRIVDTKSNKSGSLEASNIDFSAPGELLVQNIRIGMLTPPIPTDNHYMLNRPEIAGSDYFQTIPAAKMTVSQYDDIFLPKVMIASGKIYDTVSDDVGGVHGGDMRENVGKSTFSVGINLANWGVTSASMQSQQQPQLTQSVVAHHSRGLYQNGPVNHGLSGGNGMLTLDYSSGNEFSHEIGHHYGMGHYDGLKDGDYFWTAHHADSGWGYIGYRNMMHGNLNWTKTNIDQDLRNGEAIFLNKYRYGRDSQSDGFPTGSISKYTYYTGYNTQRRIQPHFEERHIWDKTSPSGYKKWNKDTREMENSNPPIPGSKEVWYNSSNGYYLKPKQFGVPVFTILGGYDPVNKVGLLYKEARGNWGNVFDLPKTNPNAMTANCWINVKFYTGKNEENIALAPQRMQANSVNKLHVNLAQSDQPKSVDLYCKDEGQVAQKLSSIEIPIYSNNLPKPVVIGKESGYSALRKIELPELEAELMSQIDKPIVTLSPRGIELYRSYRLHGQELSMTAQQQMQRYTQQENQLYRLNRWVNAYANDLRSGNQDAQVAFTDFVNKIDLSNDAPLANSAPLILPAMRNSCLKAEELATGKISAYISGKNGCTGEASEKWIYDAMGKIHNEKYVDRCLSSSMELTPCRNDTASQIWTMDDTKQQIRQGNQCLDLHGGRAPDDNGRGIATRYACSGTSNQRWTMLQSNNSLILSAAPNQNLALITTSLSKANP